MRPPGRQVRLICTGSSAHNTRVLALLFDNRGVGQVHWPQPDGSVRVAAIRDGFDLAEVQRWAKNREALPVSQNKGAEWRQRPDGGQTLFYRCPVCRRPRAITEEKLGRAVDEHRSDHRVRRFDLDVGLLPG